MLKNNCHNVDLASISGSLCSLLAVNRAVLASPLHENGGGLAQLGERLNGIQEVVGSIPIPSTNYDSSWAESMVFNLYSVHD